MRFVTRCLAAATLLLSVIPISASAWNAPPAGVITIAEARERAETGDYMVIEGIVIAKKSDTYFEIEDATGRMIIVIPDYLIRSEGAPADSELVRVAGKYDHKKLDKSVEGLRVMTLWRGDTGNGARGAAPAGAARAAAPKPSAPAAAADAGRNAGSDEGAATRVYRPTADAATVEKLARARREWLESISELETASSEYARALYAAGDGGAVDPAIVARNDAAEDRVAAASERIPLLVEEARREGVSEDVLRLYIQMTSRSN